MRPTRRETGAKGEDLAVAFLERQGYEVLQRNFRCREGEIDIVAQQGQCLVFVEVRTRAGAGFGTPEESISRSKKEKLVSLAEAYVQARDVLPSSWRIDVVAVELAPDGRVVRLEHIENAVE